MKKYLFSLVLSLFFTSLFSQSWTELLNSTNACFFDVQEAFYDEWGDKPYERGKGVLDLSSG